MFEGVKFPAKALDYGCTWPKGWTWMCDTLNIMACVGVKPAMLCSFEKFHGRRYKSSVLPYMMPGRRSVNLTVKSVRRWNVVST